MYVYIIPFAFAYSSKKKQKHLTLKAPIKTAADDIHIFFFHFYSKKIRLDVSSEAKNSHEKSSLIFFER